MATTTKDNVAAENAQAIASGNDVILMFPVAVEKVWVRCRTGSATSMRVKVTPIHQAEYIILAAGESMTFEGVGKNKITSVTLSPNTAAQTDYDYTVLKK